MPPSLKETISMIDYTIVTRKMLSSIVGEIKVEPRFYS